MTTFEIAQPRMPAGRAFSVRLAQHYHACIVVLAILGLYCGVTMYLSKLKVDRPSLWTFALIAFAVPLLVTRIESWRTITRSPLTAWTLLFFAVNIASYGWSSRSTVATGILRETMYNCLMILCLIVILSSKRAVELARRCVVFCVWLALVMNAIDLIHPGIFSENLGRAAGLYVNPNTAGAAIVLGLVLGIGVVPDRRRGAFVVAAAIGVLSTLSRADILGLVFVLGTLITRRLVRVRSIIKSVAMVTLSGLVLLVGTSKGQQLRDLFELATRYGVLDRIADTSVSSQEANYSTQLRVAVLKKGWAMFQQHPLRGAGIGATYEWGMKQSTHNIYVRHLAEFGAIGFVLYPLLLCACVIGAQGEERSTALMFAGFLTLNGFFTHNILEERNFLVAYVLMSAIASQSLLNEVARRRQAILATDQPSPVVM